MSETELIQRLEKLERDNRRMKSLGIVAALIVAVLVTIAAMRPVPDVIKAHAFEVTDMAGKTRASIETDGIRFYDEDGTARAAMGIHSGEPLLVLQGKTGTVGLDTISRSGLPGIWLQDAGESFGWQYNLLRKDQ